MAGTNNPEININFRIGTDRTNPFFLHRAQQFYLHIERQFGNFIQKQATAVC